jgi:hypothetical protein
VATQQADGKKSIRERELALKEAASARWDMVLRSLLSLINFPLYIVDKLRIAIGISAVGYFCIYLPMTAAAGKKTEMLVQVIADLAINKWAYLLLVTLLAGGNIIQGVTFHRYVKRKGQRESELEAYIDPERESSGLSPSGMPPKMKETQ